MVKLAQLCACRAHVNLPTFHEEDGVHIVSRLFCLALLIVHLSAARATAQDALSATMDGVSYTAQHGLVQAARNGVIRWSRQLPFSDGPAFQDVSRMLPAGRFLVLVSGLVSETEGEESATVIALDLQTGQTRWTHTLDGRPDGLWFVSSPRIIFVGTYTAGAMISGRTAGYRLEDGFPMAIPESAQQVTAAGPLVVFDDVWGDSTVLNDPSQLHYNVFDARTNQNQHVTFDVPARAGCGAALPFPDKETMDDRDFTPERIVVRRVDQCGQYVVLVDWQQSPPTAVIEVRP